MKPCRGVSQPPSTAIALPRRKNRLPISRARPPKHRAISAQRSLHLLMPEQGRRLCVSTTTTSIILPSFLRRDSLFQSTPITTDASSRLKKALSTARLAYVQIGQALNDNPHKAIFEFLHWSVVSMLIPYSSSFHSGQKSRMSGFDKFST